MHLKSTLSLSIISFVIVLASCHGSKNFSATGSNDEIVYKAFKFLNKRPDDAYALGELKFNYQQAVKNHQERINTWRNSPDVNRWDNIINELSSLQGLYDAINTSSALLKATNAQSYFNAISVAKDSAALDYYNTGLDYFGKEGRENLKEAYHYFKKTDDYVNNYKDCRQKMKEAFDKSSYNVVINPVDDGNLYSGSWQTGGYQYNREEIQQLLVRDLGGDNSSTNPARFYTDRNARRKNVEADWVIDLAWQNVYIPQPTESRSSLGRSKKIEIGRDTLGKPIYETVNATLYVTRLTYIANGSLEYNVTDVKQKKRIDLNNLPVTVTWKQEYATYSGDVRALSDSDMNLVYSGQQPRNNSNETILKEMGQRVYYDLRNRLRKITDW